MSTSAEAEVKRAEVHGALLKHHQRAWAVYSQKAGDVPESVASTVKGSLAMDGQRIARLGPTGDLGIAASSGSWPHEKWIAYAKLQWDDINAQLRYLGEADTSWSNTWNQVFTATVTDIKTSVGEALPSKFELGSVLVLVVVGLVAVAVIKVT